MNRNERIQKSERLRKGLSVAKIKQDEHGRRFTESQHLYESLNQAKRANGIGSVALQRGENFPPKEIELPALAEAVTV